MANGNSTSIDAGKPPRPSTKGRPGPVQTVSNNTSALTEGDLARARAAQAFPADTLFRIASVAMALTGARELANEHSDGGDEDSGVLGILDLALAELTRLPNDHEAFNAVKPVRP
jgi:hypothetical protein